MYKVHLKKTPTIVTDCDLIHCQRFDKVNLRKVHAKYTNFKDSYSKLAGGVRDTELPVFHTKVDG